MYKMLFTMIVLLLTAFISVSMADERCFLEGNTYVLTIEDVSYELSGFECTFGPGCSSDCDLWYGDFDSGPLWHVVLPFSCNGGTVVIAGVPCELTDEGNLKCLMVDTSSYHCYKISGGTYCLPSEAAMVQFDIGVGK